MNVRTARVFLLVWVIWVSCFAPAARAAGEIRLQNTKFLEDGKIWRAKGIDIEAFITCKNGAKFSYAELRQYWNADLLKSLRDTFHINTIRFQVSQLGLDPEAKLCDQSYREEIVSAVRLARKEGFTVVLSLDWQEDWRTPNGDWKPLKDLYGMPDPQTLRAWKNLAPAFARDENVFYELFVEPKEWPSDSSRKQWARGIQPVITAVRAAGAQNIILLDGLAFGRNLKGLAPLFHDPMPNRWAFVVDPQLTEDFKTPQAWDEWFGRVAEEYPTLAAGFNMTDRGHCLESVPPTIIVPQLLNYLKAKGIGLIAWGDLAETLWHKHNPTDLTNYAHFRACHDDSHSGVGELFGKW